MTKISHPDRWCKGQLVAYDKDTRITKYDLNAALGYAYMELTKTLPTGPFQHRLINLNSTDDIQQVYDAFVDAYEEVHGPVYNDRGNPIKSTQSQVKICAINDLQTHSELIIKLLKLTEKLNDAYLG